MYFVIKSNIGLKIIDYHSDSYPFAREPGKAAETRESLKLVHAFPFYKKRSYKKRPIKFFNCKKQ